MRRSELSRAGFVAAAMVTGVVRLAAAQETVVSAGVNVRVVSGTFGSTETTRLVYAPAVVRVDTGRFELAGYFPYLTIDEGTVTLSQGGYVPMQGTLTGAPGAGMPMTGTNAGMMGGRGNPALTNQAGFGDVVASVGYRVRDDAVTGLQVIVGTRVKLPTATAARGLGTGRTDVGGTATIRRRSTSGWWYGEGGYLVVGDSTDLDLRNAWLWSAGGGWRLSNRVFLLGSAYGNTAILREFAAPIELGAGIGLRLGERVSVTVLPTAGITDASPRYSLTVGLSTEMFRR